MVGAEEWLGVGEGGGRFGVGEMVGVEEWLKRRNGESGEMIGVVK